MSSSWGAGWQRRDSNSSTAMSPRWCSVAAPSQQSAPALQSGCLPRRRHADIPTPTRPPARLLQLASGQRSTIPQGQGVRIGGEKFMWLRELKGETYPAKIKDADGSVASHPVRREG